MLPNLVLIKISIRYFNREFSTILHGIPSIYSQIHDDLLNLYRIGINQSNTWLSPGNQINIFAD